MLKLLLFRFLFPLRPKLYKSIPEVVAASTLFQETEIQSFYEKVGSWDMVLAACGYAGLMGIGNLTYAFENMRTHHPNASAEELYKTYGVI